MRACSARRPAGEGARVHGPSPGVSPPPRGPPCAAPGVRRWLQGCRSRAALPTPPTTRPAPAALPSWAAAVLAPAKRRRSRRSRAEEAALADLIALTTDPALARGAKGGKAARARVEAAIDALIAAAGDGPAPPTARDPAINGGKCV
jgi:hypothetical protein